MKEKERIYELLREPSKVRIGHREALLEVQKKFPSFSKVTYLLGLIDAREEALAPSKEHQQELLSVRKQWENEGQSALQETQLPQTSSQIEDFVEPIGIDSSPLHLEETHEESAESDSQLPANKDLVEQGLLEDSPGPEQIQSNPEEAKTPEKEDDQSQQKEDQQEVGVESIQPKNSYEENLIKLGLGHLIGASLVVGGTNTKTGKEPTVDLDNELAQSFLPSDTKDTTVENTNKTGQEVESKTNDLTEKSYSLAKEEEREASDNTSEKESDGYFEGRNHELNEPKEEDLNPIQDNVQSQKKQNSDLARNTEISDQEQVLANTAEGAEDEPIREASNEGNIETTLHLPQGKSDRVDLEPQDKLEREEKSSEITNEAPTSRTEQSVEEIDALENVQDAIQPERDLENEDNIPIEQSNKNADLKKDNKLESANKTKEENTPIFSEATAESGALDLTPNAENKYSSKRDLESWLDLGAVQESNLKRGEEKKPQEKIIQAFLEKTPKIKVDKEATHSPKKMNEELEEGFKAEWVTETLANIYLQQKKYDLAIQSFEILGLKYPEKSTYFAGRMGEVITLRDKI